jgi:hypothetical protein
MRIFTKSLLALALSIVCVGGAKAVNHFLVYSNGTAAANNWDKQAVCTLNSSLEVGKSYVVKAKIKVDAAIVGDIGIQLVPIFSTSENKDQWGNSADVQYLAVQTPTTDFVEYSWYFDAEFPIDKFQFFQGKISGNVYYDDVTCKEVGQSTEYVDNGDFEQPGIANWGTNYQGPSFSQGSDVVNADNALVYSNGTAAANNWDKQAVCTLNSSLEVGKTYVVKAKIKVDAAIVDNEIGIQLVPIFSTSENRDQWNNSTDVQYLAVQTPTTDFVEYSWYFDAEFPIDKFQFFQGKISGNVYYDDVTCKEVGQSTEYVDNGDFSASDISNWSTNYAGPSFTLWNNEVAMTIGKSGFATFSNSKAVRMEGVTAYAAKYTGGKVTLTSVTEVPSGVGVIIEAAEGSYTVPAINSAAVLDNDLLVSDGSVTGNGTIYELGEKSGVVGFVKVTSGVAVPAGEAYLVIPAGDRDFIGFGDDETTDINAVEQATKADNQYFNLAGQRVAQPTKGLYIVNGKKVILK